MSFHFLSCSSTRRERVFRLLSCYFATRWLELKAGFCSSMPAVILFSFRRCLLQPNRDLLLLIVGVGIAQPPTVWSDTCQHYSNQTQRILTGLPLRIYEPSESNGAQHYIEKVCLRDRMLTWRPAPLLHTRHDTKVLALTGGKGLPRCASVRVRCSLAVLTPLLLRLPILIARRNSFDRARQKATAMRLCQYRQKASRWCPECLKAETCQSRGKPSVIRTTGSIRIRHDPPPTFSVSANEHQVVHFLFSLSIDFIFSFLLSSHFQDSTLSLHFTRQKR